jgi:hypothetical protein
MARSLYRYKQDLLTGWGFLTFESREIARTYTTKQIRTLPYLQSLIRSRRLFVSNFKKRDFPISEIRDRVYALYDKSDWLTDDGRPDIWKMIRRYRKIAIDTVGDGHYEAPKRRGSHHPKGSGISKGQLDAQRKKRKAKTNLEKYDEGRGRG